MKKAWWQQHRLPVGSCLFLCWPLPPYHTTWQSSSVGVYTRKHSRPGQSRGRSSNRDGRVVMLPWKEKATVRVRAQGQAEAARQIKHFIHSGCGALWLPFLIQSSQQQLRGSAQCCSRALMLACTVNPRRRASLAPFTRCPAGACAWGSRAARPRRGSSCNGGQQQCGSQSVNVEI